MAGEGEGKAQRQSSTFHSHVVQEVGDAVHNVVEELGRDVFLVVRIVGDILGFIGAACRAEIRMILFQK